MIHVFMLILATFFCTGKNAYRELEEKDLEPSTGNVVTHV